MGTDVCIENDLIKYRLVRLLLTGWLFCGFATVFLIFTYPSKILPALLFLVGLIASAKLICIMFYDGDKVSRFGLLVLALLGFIALLSNGANMTMLLFMDAINPNAGKDVIEKRKLWFGNDEKNDIGNDYQSNRRPHQPEVPPVVKSKDIEKSSPRPIQKPIPPNPITTHDVQRFIQNHLRHEEQGDIGAFMKGYTQHLKYDGKLCDKGEISGFKIPFWKFYRKRSISIQGKIHITASFNNNWNCRLKTKFRHESQMNNKWRSGEASYYYHIKQVRDVLQITEEKRTVSKLDEGKLDEKRLPTTRDSILKFVYQRLEAEASRDIERVMAGYAPVLENYFGKRRTALEIKREKSQYYQRYPGWKETLIPRTATINQTGRRWEVRFKTRFEAWNNTTNKHRSGTVDNVYVVEVEDSKMSVVVQDGKVTLDR